MSSTSPTSPLDCRDIRSAARPFKRDKDQESKWSNGQRPSCGVNIIAAEELIAGHDDATLKVRPRKQWSQTATHNKTHANKTPKQHMASQELGAATNRLAHKADAMLESNEHMSTSLYKSFLKFLPQHANNTSSPIQIAIQGSTSTGGDVLYSFDNKGPSPDDNGRKVELGGLVEKAEKKWVAEQTEKIVRVEYEVLDAEGEVVRGKGKRSPKQRAIRNQASDVKDMGGEDDGFELV